jgi:hypothetical protein
VPGKRVTGIDLGGNFTGNPTRSERLRVSGKDALDLDDVCITIANSSIQEAII